MQIHPVSPAKPERQFLKEIARKPFAPDSIGSSGDVAPPAVGAIYTQEGKIKDSVNKPGQFIHEIR
ncbi:MAG: hypothetical protein AUJ12_01415 [Alphaproteobacteria bacterium CG1_02_46_17]|nr:MAG: hypothetical protein AUJ12_01415 [Alphaproteobacteria bacterium CG1_02_46_17]